MQHLMAKNFWKESILSCRPLFQIKTKTNAAKQLVKMETCSGFSEAEIGRLVCGYLTSLGCKSTIEKFLQESKAELKIREFASLVDQGILKNFDVDGLNLVDVLYEYSQ